MGASIWSPVLTDISSLQVILDSVAQLRAFNTVITEGLVFTKGYYTPGDQGHGYYRLDAADTSSPDDGCAVIVDALNNRWKLLIEGVLNIRQAGCKIDGITNDTVRFQAAVDVAAVVLVPYSTSTCLINNDVLCANKHVILHAQTSGAGQLRDAVITHFDTTKLQLGKENAFGYTDNAMFQVYRDQGIPTTIQPMMRAVVSSQGDNTTFIGSTGMYIEARDKAGITAGQRGVLYALHCSVVPSHPRNNVPYDDVAALTLGNTTGTIGANGTDCIYVSANSFAFGNKSTGTPEWYSIFTADCNATVGYQISGKIETFAIDIGAANLVIGSAIRFPNNTFLVARNAANSANLNLIGLNVDNIVQLGGTNASGVKNNNCVLYPTPVSTGAGTYTVLSTDVYLTFSAACTVTLPVAGSWPGRAIKVRNTSANAVISASSNVVPRAGGAAGTAILAAAAGNWAELVSDGAAWQIMSGS